MATEMWALSSSTDIADRSAGIEGTTGLLDGGLVLLGDIEQGALGEEHVGEDTASSDLGQWEGTMQQYLRLTHVSHVDRQAC